MWEVIFYKKENDEVPVLKFIKSIEDIKLKAKLIRDIGLLEQYGNKLKTPHSKKITNEKYSLYELRTKQSTNIIRIIYFFSKNRQIIMVNGFIKKTGKIPTREIETAKRYRDKWEVTQNE